LIERETNFHGPVPTGALENPSSPTCSKYFFGIAQSCRLPTM